MIKINDIKTIVEIPDFSIYLYYGALVICILLILLVVFFTYKFLKPKPKSKKYEYYTKLKNLDFNNIKQTAYDISKYGRLLAIEERQIRLIDELCDELAMYKYKKNISVSLSNDIKTKFHIFLESIDV
jgi:ribosomal protein S10